MFTLEIVKRFGPWVILILGLAVSVYLIRDSGYDAGSADVQAKWDSEKEAHAKAMRSLQDKYATLEAKVRTDNQRNSDELAAQETAHAVALAQLNQHFAERMLKSDKRASYYERLAKGGAAQQADLARHAAELDRSLEEGRRVVAELSETVRQRDNQCRALGNQLVNDRSLFNMGK